jgi:hypothetical protein
MVSAPKAAVAAELFKKLRRVPVGFGQKSVMGTFP